MFKKMLCVFGLVLLCACSKQKVTRDNYQKIENNMSVAQVTQILGKPTEENAINIAGISARAASWKETNGTIVITFVNDRVTAKNFNNSKR